MTKMLLFSIWAFLFLEGSLQADEKEPNRVIQEFEKSLIGEWQLVEGLSDTDVEDERIWSFSSDHVVTDSREKRPMHFVLLQNAQSEIWMMMLSHLSDACPMMARVQIKGEKLILNPLGKTAKGTYGPTPEGAIIFKRIKDETNPK